MPLPKSREARNFYRCAAQRFEEARFLFQGGYTTGAVYLAGYAVECALKGLLLSIVPEHEQIITLKSFRTRRAHEFEWLRNVYVSNGGAPLPASVVRHLASVSFWSTDLRYSVQRIKLSEARRFLSSTAAILEWAQGRL